MGGITGARHQEHVVSFRGWDKNEVTVLLKTIGKLVGDQIRPLQKQIAELKAQIAELQERGIKFSGTFQRGNEYRRGEMCAYDGSIWCALTDTKPLQIPGKDAVWQLAVRGQRDAPRLPTKGGPREQPEQRRT
jgi:hypothetical protein